MLCIVAVSLHPPILEIVFVKIIKFATMSADFSFNDIMFRQIDFMAMVNPLGSIIAKIIFYALATQLLFTISRRHFLCVQRWVGGRSFYIFIEQFVAVYYSTEERLFSNISLCLCTKINSEFITSVYLKPTFSALYNRWESFCLRRYKMNLDKTLMISFNKLEQELTFISYFVILAIVRTLCNLYINAWLHNFISPSIFALKNVLFI